MRRKNLWLRMSSCTMAALLAATSVAPVSAADFTSEVVVEDQQDEAGADVDVATDAEVSVIEEESQDETAEVEVTEDSAEADLTEAEEDLFADSIDADEVGDAAALTDDAEVQKSFNFGSASTTLEVGEYSLTASLMNAGTITNPSMAGSCIAGDATLVVSEDGSAKLTVPLQAVTVGTVTAFASDWNYYKAAVGSDKTAAEYTTNSDGKVNSITFTVPDKTADGIYLNMYIDAMKTNQDAYLKLDYASAKKKAVETSALEATIAKADALEENSYTKATWDKNISTINTANAEAKAALEKKASQAAVDAADKALTDAMAKLVLAGDPTELQAKLAEIKEKMSALNEEEYLAYSWNNVNKQITTAEKRIKERYAQNSLDSSIKNLDDYFSKLTKIYSSEKLEEKLNEAEALKEEDYTEESWNKANLAFVILEGKEILNNMKSKGSKQNIMAAAEKLDQAMDVLIKKTGDIVVGRGAFQKTLTPGTYSLPVELLNGSKIADTNEYTSANYMSYKSAAAGCFSGPATLVIHEDGSATISVGVQAISNLGLTDAATDWTVYESTEDYFAGKSATCVRYNARIDETKVVGGKNKPSRISFTVPDLKQNVVAVHIYVEAMSFAPEQSACIGLDWLNLKKVSDDTSATSTVAKEYVVAPDIQTQLKNMTTGSTVKLTEDVTLTESISIKGGTIDLNGHTLNQEDSIIRIKGDVAIIDGSEEKTGKIVKGSEAAYKTSILLQSGSLTADGVYIDGQIGNNAYALQEDIEEVSLVLKNCRITRTSDKKDQNNFGPVSFSLCQNNVDVKISGSSIDGNVSVGSRKSANVNIDSSELGGLNVGGNANVTNTKMTSGYSEIGGKKITLSNASFTGLCIYAQQDCILENISSNSERRSALEIGNGQVTIKGGCFVSGNGYAVETDGAPVIIEGGYFKGGSGSVSGPYTTPEGKILGDVTEGEYAGYQALVDGTVPDVENPVAVIYNADGSIARKIAEGDTAYALAYAGEGQIVQLKSDVNISKDIHFYKNIRLDLNGFSLNVERYFSGTDGKTCYVIDGSTDKTGKITSSYIGIGTIVLDNITVSSAEIYGAYFINGTRVNDVTTLDGVARDCVVTVAESVADSKAVIEKNIRTSQCTITADGERTFTIKENELGTAMRAFEALEEATYTKTSYAAAKAVYDAIDQMADVDIQGDVVAQKAKELNDAVAALQKVASEDSVNALKSAVEEAKKLKAADYTETSFKALTEAIAAAEKVLAGEEFTETDVTTATEALADANAKLVKQVAQTITAADSFNKKFGEAAFNLGAKAKTALTYSSGNANVAAVDAKGNVTIKGIGTAKITITAAADGSYLSAVKTVTVTVAKGNQTITTTKDSYKVSKGSKAFKLNTKAAGAVTYKSSNKKVATVDKNGKITVKGLGTAKITISAAATSTYNAGSKVVTVKVTKPAPTIKVKKTSATVKASALKKKAKTVSLSATVNSKGKIKFKKVSGSNKITVNSKGKVTVKKGIKKGTYKVKVRVTAAAKGKYSAGSKTVTVTVKVK